MLVQDLPSPSDVFADVHVISALRVLLRSESSSFGKLDISGFGFQRRQQHAVLDRDNIILHLLIGQVFTLEPIRQDELSPGRQELVRVLKEQGLVGEMRERLGYPDDVECTEFILSAEKVSHLFRVERDEFDGSTSGSEVDTSPRFRRCGFTSIFSTEVVRDFNLFIADCDTSSLPSHVLGKVSSRTAYAASDIEDFELSGRRAVSTESSSRKEELDECDLSIFFREVRGFFRPVSVVDVLSPGGRRTTW